MRTLYLLPLTFLFFSCGEQNKPVAEKKDSLSIAQPMKSDTVPVKEDPILHYPSDSLATSVVILNEENYHNDEIDPKTFEYNWVGLFKGKTYYIAPTKLKYERVEDAVVDENGEKTAWQISCDNMDTTLLLMGNIDYLTRGDVQGTSSLDEKLDVKINAAPYKFTYAGKEYELSAKGKESEDKIIQRYQLFITGEKNGRRITQLLVAHPHLEEADPSIIFCGDLDGDGIPDLIINSTYHYNLTQPTLYLSGKASEDQLYLVVAIHASVGC